jgi:peptide/nickel transport system permease protein
MTTPVKTRVEDDVATTPPTASAGFSARLRSGAPMATFIGRRVLSSAVVLIGATFIVYMLLSYALDPLADLYESTAPNKDVLIEARIRLLDLDTPVILRYLGWLGGAAGCVVGQCDLGASWVTNQSVVDLLGTAIPSTMSLISASTFLAIGLGIAVGIASALRQYTGFDYGVTFLSFVLYSLPSFWVAVLLKQWGAIGFNDFLRDPTYSPLAVAGLSVLAGLIWMTLVGGDRRRRVITLGVATAGTAALLSFLSLSGWFLEPSLGIAGIAVLGAAIALGVSTIAASPGNRRALYASLTTVMLGVALYYPLQYVFVNTSAGLIVGLAVVAVLAGVLVGYLFGGADRAQSMRSAGITSIAVAALVFIDRVMAVWPTYSNASRINGRPIATIGSQTPNLQGDFWVDALDLFTHLLLPTIALILISFAAYTRYSRASLLEVMNQDYIRTARAKGLSERTVTMRHAFRNALIPLATIVPLDIAALFGGAIITERIFAWSGMGTLFLTGLHNRDANPIMGYFIVVGTLLVLANIVVDFVYAALDPRIRVNA